MTKAELESKHLSDLHALAAEAGVERFRMLSRSELIEKLSDGDGAGGNGEAPTREPRERSAPRRRRSRGGRGRSGEKKSSDEVSGRGDALREEAFGRGDEDEVAASEPSPSPDPSPPASPVPATPPAEEAKRPPRRRRRRRFGRRKEGVTIQDLLLPPEAGRQAVLAAESREACTALLRGVAADLAADTKGPDPVILLIDPSPDELGDWKREAPQAEIVAAGQAHHANDALAQAAARAGNGDDVILLVDSLTRLASDFGDTDTAKEFFDAGRAQGGAGGGSLTVVAAIERSA
jgi:transcription termination factor Rho